uniref:Cytochrome P450 n=1 Tax=Trichogramma kaykai TaxID=54128 RepID=A0ABD2X9K7_9HYME
MSEAAAQAFVFFLAGFETSASTATYALLELAMNQEIQRRLQREIDQVADGPEGFTFEKIESMEYLDMVLSETFRKYSAVAFLNRLCVEEYRIPVTSYTPCPRVMRLVTSSHGVHHDPDIYPRFAASSIPSYSGARTSRPGAARHSCSSARARETASASASACSRPSRRS